MPSSHGLSHDASGVPELDPRRKRARFRAWHRGTRELDLIMGRFADREIATLSEAELGEFERLMEEPDPAVYDWVTVRAVPPASFDTPLLGRLRLYRG